MSANFDLSASLFEMRRMFTGQGDIVQVDREGAAEALKAMAMRAREMERELDRLQWNERAQMNRKAGAAVIAAELQRDGTNIRLFPIAARPEAGL